MVQNHSLKTGRINFKKFNFSKAKLFPIYISSNTILKSLEGQIVLPSKIYPGIVEVGIFEIAIFDKRHDYGVIDIKPNSKLIFEGRACFGVGSKISTNPKSKLTIGKNFLATSTLTIICSDRITIKDYCLISWNIQIMDTDFHMIFPSSQKSTGITIGKKNWLGHGVNVLKNTSTAQNTVIGACSLVNKCFTDSNVILAGMPAKIVKRDINWG